MNPPYSPYQIPVVPPTGYWLGPIDELLAPARRAGLLMIILGSLSLLGGVCMLAVLALPVDQLLRDSNITPADIANTGFTPQQFIKVLVVMMSSIFVGVAITMLIMGFLVRRGGAASAIVSLVLVSLLALLLALQTLVQGIRVLSGDPRMIASVGITLLILAVLVLLIVWLVGAIRAAGSLKQLKQQQLAQWYAMQHHPAWTGYGQVPPQAPGGGPTS